MKIQLLNMPNQKVPVSVKGYLLVFEFHQFRGQLFCSIALDGEYIVSSLRVIEGENLLPYPLWADRIGKFCFRNKYNTPITDYKSYNDAVYLEYLAPGEY